MKPGCKRFWAVLARRWRPTRAMRLCRTLRPSAKPCWRRDRAVGLFALLPQVVDSVRLPVVATGGIADARGVAAALTLGASAVQLGTAFLSCPEAGIATAWADGLRALAPEDTQLTRAFSGRLGLKG